MDFKGWHRLQQGIVHPLTILDDHSRYLLALHATDNQLPESVQAVMTACFRRCGST